MVSRSVRRRSRAGPLVLRTITASLAGQADHPLPDASEDPPVVETHAEDQRPFQRGKDVPGVRRPTGPPARSPAAAGGVRSRRRSVAPKRYGLSTLLAAACAINAS